VECCELEPPSERIVLEPIALLSVPITFFTKLFINERKGAHAKQLKTDYVRVSKKRLVVRELVVLVGLGCLHNNLSLWVITLHKIVLVVKTAP
jgi:hypothetical protein